MRNRLFKLLLLPAAVFIWIIGWIMMWAGSRKEETKPDPAKTEQPITIMSILHEEQEQSESRTPA